MMFFKTRVLLWPVLLMFSIAIALVVVAPFALRSIPEGYGIDDDERNIQVVKSIEREEQVVLVSLGIEGIDEKRQNGNFYGAFIPGTERAKFIRYGFDAKLGIDGRDVLIEQTGDDSFRITIPEFIFIGYDDFEYEIAADSNGILSWTTPEIDESEMVNNIMDDELKSSHVASNKALLIDQAKTFYLGIIESVDEDVDVTFVFADGIGDAE